MISREKLEYLFVSISIQLLHYEGTASPSESSLYHPNYIIINHPSIILISSESSLLGVPCICTKDSSDAGMCPT